MKIDGCGDEVLCAAISSGNDDGVPWIGVERRSNPRRNQIAIIDARERDRDPAVIAFTTSALSSRTSGVASSARLR